MKKLATITAAQVEAVTDYPLTFDLEEHRYFKGPIELPSLSAVLGSAGLTDDFSDRPQIVLDKIEHKRQLGHAVHKRIEFYFAGQSVDPDSIHPETVPYFEAFEKFMADKKPVLWASETPVCSLEHWYACTPDLLCVPKGEPPTLYEFKNTYSISKFVRFQLAGQQLCLGIEMRRFVCQLKKDGTYELWPKPKKGCENVGYTDPQDAELVKAAAKIHKWKVVGFGYARGAK